ncbi:MAG: SEC-C metal-binding domain-containing protein [Pseudomonadota bacterium]
MLFTFVRIREQGGTTVLEDEFVAESAMRKRFPSRVRDVFTTTEAEAKRVLAAWVMKLPELEQELKSDRRRVKDVGRMLVKRHRERKGKPVDRAPAEMVKAPRNAPCPCGSGKKYKKCCGRG